MTRTLVLLAWLTACARTPLAPPRAAGQVTWESFVSEEAEMILAFAPRRLSRDGAWSKLLVQARETMFATHERTLAPVEEAMGHADRVTFLADRHRGRMTLVIEGPSDGSLADDSFVPLGIHQGARLFACRDEALPCALAAFPGNVWVLSTGAGEPEGLKKRLDQAKGNVRTRRDVGSPEALLTIRFFGPALVRHPAFRENRLVKRVGRGLKVAALEVSRGGAAKLALTYEDEPFAEDARLALAEAKDALVRLRVDEPRTRWLSKSPLAREGDTVVVSLEGTPQGGSGQNRAKSF